MKITCTFSAALLLAPLAALHSADAKEPGGAGNRIATAKQAMEKAMALMRPISTKADIGNIETLAEYLMRSASPVR